MGEMSTPKERSSVRFGSEWKQLQWRLKFARYEHVVVTVGPDSIVAIGGSPAGQSVEMLNVKTGESQILPDMTRKRRFPAAVVFGRKIFVFGGCDNRKNLSEFLDLDNLSNGWQRVPGDGAAETINGDFATVVGSKIFVVWGIDFEARLRKGYFLDPKTYEWESIKLPGECNSRNGGAVACMFGSSLLVTGRGESVDSLDMETLQWGRSTMVSDLHSRTRFHTAVAIGPNHLAIIGGDDGQGHVEPSDAAFIYDKSTRIWSALPRMNVKREKCYGVFLGSRVYIVSGTDNQYRYGSIEYLEVEMDTKAMFFSTLQLIPGQIKSTPDGQLVTITPELEAAIECMDDFLQLKFIYTAVNAYHRMETISPSDRVRLIRKALAKARSYCTSPFHNAMYHIALDRAKQVGVIDDFDKYALGFAATETQISHSDFIRCMQELLVENSKRIAYIETTVEQMRGAICQSLRKVNENIMQLRDDMSRMANAVDTIQQNIESVNDSLNKFRAGYRFKMRVETAGNFLSSVLNAVTFGAAGGVLSGALGLTLGRIVDFGAIADISNAVSFVGQLEEGSFDHIEGMTVKESLEIGIGVGVDSFSERKLTDAVKKDNAITVITAAASLFSGSSDGHASESEDSSTTPDIDQTSEDQEIVSSEAGLLLESSDWESIQELVEDMVDQGDRAATAAERYIISKGRGYFGGEDHFNRLVQRAVKKSRDAESESGNGKQNAVKFILNRIKSVAAHTKSPGDIG